MGFVYIICAIFLLILPGVLIVKIANYLEKKAKHDGSLREFVAMPIACLFVLVFCSVLIFALYLVMI